MIRLGVYGGCVSRDVLNYTNETDHLVLAFYTARSSLASLAGKPYVQNEVLERLSSNFQRRQVGLDMSKKFLPQLRKGDFDLLLLDFISQRYPVLSDQQGGLLTMSGDYLRAAPRPLVGRVVRNSTPMYTRLWERGLAKLYEAVKAAGKLDSVLLSELYWTREPGGDEPFPQATLDSIDRENAYLSSLYEKFCAKFGRESLIKYPDECLVADPKHRWGHAPYHYTEKLYLHTLGKIKSHVAKIQEYKKSNEPV